MYSITFLFICSVVTTNIVSGFYPFIYNSPNNGTLPYRLYIPENINKGEKYPLLVYFHGMGSVGNDNMKPVTLAKLFAEKQIQEKHPCFILAPQSTKPWVNTNWGLLSHQQPAITTEMQMAIEIISKVIAEYPVDTARIYLIGASMGGFAAWDLLCRKPEMFAAAVPVCGGADETKAAIIKDVPVWAFHGAIDSEVKVVRTRNMIDALKKAGGKPLYTEYEHTGHNAWDLAFKDEAMIAWLFQQSIAKKPAK